MITILGAGGPVANELAAVLAARGTAFRLVGRNPKPIHGGEVFAADIADPEQAQRAVAGSTVVHLLIGLKYDIRVWRELWPRIMSNTIEACKRAGARLIFFDNVYLYGKVDGAMTEETPVAPCSRKGELRARIAGTLMDEVKAGRLPAMIARAADFYGPKTEHGVPNVLVLEAMAKKSKPAWFANAKVPHSFTFTPDAARGVDLLSQRESAWNQVWHLPTAPDPPTGEQFIAMAAREFGAAADYRVLKAWMLKLAGLYRHEIGESAEMLYQFDAPYRFDSSKFAREFGFAGTPYAEGIRIAAKSYRP